MFDRKVEIEELEELEHTQKADVATVLENEDGESDGAVEPMLQAIGAVVAAPDAGAKPAWADNLELANHYTDAVADALVKHVHDLMADDVAALVHEHVAGANDDEVEYEGLIPDFFADTAQAVGTDDAPELDDTMLVSSSNRRFIEDDDPWNSGGGGGGPGAPPAGSGGDDAPPENPPEDPNKKKAGADVNVKKSEKPDPKPPNKPSPAAPRRDDKGNGGKR